MGLRRRHAREPPLALAHHFGQLVDLAGGLHDHLLELVDGGPVIHRDPGRVIASVFQPAQAVQQLLDHGLLVRGHPEVDVREDAAHYMQRCVL
jgi:hypothetical protein